MLNMIKESIYFSIGFEDVDWRNEEEVVQRNAFIKSFTAPFNIKCGFAGQGMIAFDHPQIDHFLDALEQYVHENKVVIDNNCAYAQDYEGDSEWYKYLPVKSIDTDYNGEIISCNAANISPKLNVSSGASAYPFVSDKFMRVVQENNLTGLEFLWCKDIGRFAPHQQWHMAIVTEFIGRGLDDPWLNVDSPNLIWRITSNILGH
ncbi:hypothetical protein [Paenibacillus sp. MMS18-CY102]|uniref:hypothetical protein n=1 Tax=Paenibacillus sp. MMS18-CY102 TaxID=2682849 RepID=UPI001365496C|nr:hypothetical protein [Paenibacillus sp. MMS18-CY102]MWC29859.1 hypothetical protein [Paenibacillus sp. MMS18-CY102]